MKYKQQIFNPPRDCQGNILYEARIQEIKNKIKNISEHANQLKAHGQFERSEFYYQEITEQKKQLENLLMSPQAFIIPMEVFYGI